jgi:hypothetical protein
VGAGTGTLFSAKSGATLQFNSLAGTSNGLTVSAPSSNVITIDNTLTGSNLGSGTGIFSSKSGSSLQFNSLAAGTGLSLSLASNTITINGMTPAYAFILGPSSAVSLTTTPTTVSGLTASPITNFTYSSNILTYTGATTGIFFISYYCEFDKVVVTHDQIRILKNGSTVLASGATYDSSNTANRLNTNAPILVSLSLNDTLAIQASQQTSSGDLLQQVYWTVFRIA